MRNKIADFLQHDEALHQLPAFQDQRDETLRSYPHLTWSAYLQELRKPKIIWFDELCLLSASLLFGKEIIVVTTERDGSPCWYKAAERHIDWPFLFTEPPLVLGNLHERHYESIHRIGTYARSLGPPARTAHLPCKQIPPTSSKITSSRDPAMNLFFLCVTKFPF